MTFIDDIYVGGKLEVRLVSYDKKWTYLADALGSTRKVLSNGQASTATFTAVTYKPFGAVVTVTGGDKLTYAGEMLDPPTGLIYLSARYYDPTLGRFYALDPELGRISQPQTLNRYVYCADNPMIHTDPTGRDAELAAIAAGIFIGGCLGLIDWAIHDFNHPERIPAYVGAGVITGATIPIIIFSGGETFATYFGVSFASGEYSALKTLFLGGSPDQVALNGIKSAFIGFAFQLIVPGIQWVPGASEVEDKMINYLFTMPIVNGLNQLSKGIGNLMDKYWPTWFPRPGQIPLPLPSQHPQPLSSNALIESSRNF